MMRLTDDEFSILLSQMRKAKTMSTHWIQKKHRYIFDDYVRCNVSKARRKFFSKSSANFKEDHNIKFAIPSTTVKHLVGHLRTFERGHLTEERFVKRIENALVVKAAKKYGTSEFDMNSSTGELEALSYFAERNPKLIVRQGGTIINPSIPIIAGSPDGFIIDNKGNFRLLEIKSPAKLREMTIKDWLKSANFNYDREIYYEEKTSSFKLTNSSRNYMQVQLCMLITNVKMTHVLIYSMYERKYIEITVYFNENFCKRLLKDIYRLYDKYLFKFFEKQLNKKL